MTPRHGLIGRWCGDCSTWRCLRHFGIPCPESTELAQGQPIWDGAAERTWIAQVTSKGRELEGDLRGLFDFLADILGRHRCDHRLTLSQVWALHAERDPEELVRELTHRGGHCDCRVLQHVAPNALET